MESFLTRVTTAGSPSRRKYVRALRIGHREGETTAIHSAFVFTMPSTPRVPTSIPFSCAQIRPALRRRLLASPEFKRTAPYCCRGASVSVPCFFFPRPVLTGVAGFLCSLCRGFFVAAALGASFAAGVLGCHTCAPGFAGGCRRFSPFASQVSG